MRNVCPPYKSGGAFTLVELLVAAALFGVLAILAATVVGSANNLSNLATEKMASARLAREVFDLMQRDLERVVAPHPARGLDSPTFFAINPVEIPSSLNNASSVFWQMSAARNPDAGNVSLVGYFVERVGTNRSELRRLLIEPADADYALYSDPDWDWPQLLSRFQAQNPPVDGDPGWVADGVIAMWVRSLDAMGNVISRDGSGTESGYRFDSREGYQSGDDASGRRYVGFHALPAFVEIGLLCVSPRDADRIASLPASTASTPTNFTDEMEAGLEAFSAANPAIKSATTITRRFRIPTGG
jgi:type II secretory pathway pseudopilin PulG